MRFASCRRWISVDRNDAGSVQRIKCLTSYLAAPTRNNSSFQMRERLQVYLVYLLLVLGIGLMGAGIAALGFAAGSVVAAGIGAGHA